jgi:16S rRNA (cytidine1402-2'-O)-methyltransferase
LVVVATPIGNLGDLSPRAIAALTNADLVCCEDTRHTGRLFSLLDLSARRLVSLHAHNEASRIAELIELLSTGSAVALVSDAGTPLVSDPGERLVAAAIAHGIEVTTVPGPSAAVAALVVSGLPTSRWAFEGFLARKGPERAEQLQRIAQSPVTSVVYEAPGRVDDTLVDLAEFCGGDRFVAIARELTKLHEDVWRGTVRDARERTGPARGEHVLVVAPAPSGAPADHAELSAAISRLTDAGLSRRDAVSAVEILLGAGHREAYDAALALGAAAGGSDRETAATPHA